MDGPTMTESKTPTRARERSRRETRERLLAAARKLFSERGLTATRAADLAREAGVAVGTLYLHFGDKEGLLREVLNASVQRVREMLHRLSSVEFETEQEHALARARAMVEFAEKEPQFARIVLSHEFLATDTGRELERVILEGNEKYMRTAMEKGRYRNDIDPALAMSGVFGMMIWVMRRWMANPEEFDREAVIDTLAKLRLNGLGASQIS